MKQIKIGTCVPGPVAEEWLKGFSNPEIIEKNLNGHKNFLHKVKPDFVKLMSDGYFAYPNPAIHKGLENISDLAGILLLEDQ